LCVSYLFFQFLFYTAFNWAYSTPLDARTTLTGTCALLVSVVSCVSCRVVCGELTLEADEHTVAPALGTRDGATLVEDLLLRREGHRLAKEAGRDPDQRNVWGEVPPLCDLPITTVNALLFPAK
jgi:hypothetical protein